MMTVIASADDQEINRIIRAILRRYEEKYPEEEVLFLSLPKNDLKERRRIVRSLVEVMNKHIPLKL